MMGCSCLPDGFLPLLNKDSRKSINYIFVLKYDNKSDKKYFIKCFNIVVISSSLVVAIVSHHHPMIIINRNNKNSLLKPNMVQ